MERQRQQQQKDLLVAVSRRSKEAPWWDFLSHCKGAEVSDSEEDDELSRDDPFPSSLTFWFTNDDPMMKPAPNPKTPDSFARVNPVEMIGARSRSNQGVGVASPETPWTQDTEASSSTSSMHDEDDDALEALSRLQSQSFGVNAEDVHEVDEECSCTDKSVNDSSTSVTIKPPPVTASTQQIDAKKCIKQQPMQMLQPSTYISEIAEVTVAVEQHDEIEEVDVIGTASSDSDDECDFIGNIEIMPISRLLPTHQRNIRKNAYDLLKRLGEEESCFDLNSVTVEEDDYEEQRQQEREAPEEVKGLNGRIGECTDMVIQLHNHIHSSNQVIDDGNVHADGFNRGAGQASDEIIADLNAEISTLTSKLEEITKELMAVKKEKEAMAMRLNIADDSSSRSSHSNKSARATPFAKSSTKQTLRAPT